MIVATALIVLRTLVVIVLALGQRPPRPARGSGAGGHGPGRRKCAAVERGHRGLQRGESHRRHACGRCWTRITPARSRWSSSTTARKTTPASVVALLASAPTRGSGSWSRPTPARARPCGTGRRGGEPRPAGVPGRRHPVPAGHAAALGRARSRMGQVGAVSGHARVGNLRSFIARCQALEYICGFNLDRRAYDAWDCITVAPGAISAVHREALRAVGRVPARDAGRGYRPDPEPAPARLPHPLPGRRRSRGPRRPRRSARWPSSGFRWCFGTMQCLWKHRDMLFSTRFKALGFFSLPSIWFFQIILVALTPLVDFMLLASDPPRQRARRAAVHGRRSCSSTNCSRSWPACWRRSR